MASLFCEEEERAVFRFLCSDGVKTTEMYCRMLLHYGDSWLVQIKVYECVEYFRDRRTSEQNSVLLGHGHLPTEMLDKMKT
jgi:hypothetical protein